MSIFKKISNVFSKTKTFTESNTPKMSLSLNKVEVNKIVNDTDLSPEEILMLDLLNEKDTSNDLFPGYWEYSYDVNAKLLFGNLVKGGFYSKEKSLVTTLQRKTIEDLKHILRDNNLKVSGKKQELIDRILSNLPQEKLDSIELIEVYKVNDKAKDIIKKNDHISYFHNSPLDISIYEAHDYKKKYPNLTPLEIAYDISSQKAEVYLKKNLWGLYRNLKHGLSVAEKNVGNIKNQLALLFEVCYIDLSGVDNNFSLEPYLLEIKEQYFFPYENSSATLAPGIVSEIKTIQVKLNLTDAQLKVIFLEVLQNYALPFHLFTKDECADILIAEFERDLIKLNEIYKVAEKRYCNKK